MISLGVPLAHSPSSETRSAGPGLALIADRLCSAEAVETVKPRHRVFVGTACATPISLVAALEQRKPIPPDVELFYFLTSGLEPLWVEQRSAYRHRCFFVGSDARALVRSGQAEYVPISLTQIPHLTANGRIKADVAFVQVSSPDANGFVSLGISVDIAMSLLRHAKAIVAEVNPFMPRTLGDTFLHIGRIDRFVLAERPLIEYAHEPADAGSKVMLRPARGSDVQSMQVMFHLMSSEDVYMRFFRKVSALSYEEAQRLCNVDFEKDVAFVAVSGPRDNEEVIGTGAYFLNPSTNLAEVAFMIVPEWQGSGLGSALQQRLKEFAIARGVRGFVAEVLQANTAMLNLARRLGKIEVKSEDGSYHVTSIFA